MTHTRFKLALLGAVIFCAPALAAAPNSRPNFIVFVADDLSWNDCGAYGHPTIQTPHIDRLAREGMRFDRAFLTTSSCSPSRASILTGRYPHATGAPELHMPLPAKQVLLTEPLRQAGYFTAAAGKWHLGPHVKKQMDRVMDQPPGPSGSDQWLELLRQRPGDKPFFLWLAAIDPHRPYNQGAPRRNDPACVVVPPYLPDLPAVREDLALYYDEICRLDDAIGAVLNELDAQGLTDDTCVVFMSDNGRPFPRAKTTLYDDGIRTPMLVRYPKQTRPGSTSDSVISSVDLAPTLLELAGAKVPESVQGKSFVRLFGNPNAVVREHAFAEHNWHDYRAFERAVCSNRFTYIRNWLPELSGSPPADAVNSPTFQLMRQLHDEGKLTAAQAQCFVAPRAAEELYDTHADPHSLQNLAADPAHAATLLKMRLSLDDWQKETGDVFDAARISPDRFDRMTGKRLTPAP